MDRQVVIRVLPDSSAVFCPPFAEDYALLLVLTAPLFTAEQRSRFISDIVASRCQYTLTFGHDCELWHDLIDECCVAADLTGKRFMMTTWHDNDTITDVIDFLWFHTSYDDFKPENLGVVMLGKNDEMEKTIRERLAELE